MEKQETIQWEDLSITARFAFREDGVPRLSFEIFNVVATDEKGNRDYARKGATESMDTVTNLDEAQTLFKGFIKWDACSHVYFGDEEGYIHLCGYYSWKNLHEAINRVWEHARSKGFTEDDFKQSL